MNSSYHDDRRLQIDFTIFGPIFGAIILYHLVTLVGVCMFIYVFPSFTWTGGTLALNLAYNYNIIVAFMETDSELEHCSLNLRLHGVGMLLDTT